MTGPKVLVHAGLPKCGSTSIQGFLADSETRLRAQGVFYPTHGRSKIGFRNHDPLLRMARDEMDATLRAIAGEAEGMRCVVISAERIAGTWPLDRSQQLLRGLNAVFGKENVEIVSYFRNPFAMIESSFAQFVVAGIFGINKTQFYAGPAEFEDYLDAFRALWGFPLWSLEGYATTLRLVFDENPVHLRSVERADLGGGGLLEDFGALIGVAEGEDIATRNKRIPARTTAALHYVQKTYGQDLYQRRSHELEGLRFPADASQEEMQVRYRFHIGADVHEKVREALISEKRALEGMFETPVAGLTHIPDWEDRGAVGLTAADIARVEAVLHARPGWLRAWRDRLRKLLAR